MADQYGRPFGAYTDLTGVVDATAQTELAANLAELLNRIANAPQLAPPGSGVEQASPDVERIHPDQAEAIRAEVQGFVDAYLAAPAT